jgi:hypothetical protein
MPASRRRKIADDMTCVCVLRKALLQKFERERDANSDVPPAVANGVQMTSDAKKRQRQSL